MSMIVPASTTGSKDLSEENSLNSPPSSPKPINKMYGFDPVEVMQTKLADSDTISKLQKRKFLIAALMTPTLHAVENPQLLNTENHTENPPPYNLKWLSDMFKFDTIDVVSAKFVEFDLMYELCFKPDKEAVAKKLCDDLTKTGCNPQYFAFNNSVRLNKYQKKKILAAGLSVEANPSCLLISKEKKDTSTIHEDLAFEKAMTSKLTRLMDSKKDEKKATFAKSKSEGNEKEVYINGKRWTVATLNPSKPTSYNDYSSSIQYGGSIGRTYTNHSAKEDEVRSIRIADRQTYDPREDRIFTTKQLVVRYGNFIFCPESFWSIRKELNSFVEKGLLDQEVVDYIC